MVPTFQALRDDAQLLVVGAQGHAAGRRVGRVAAHLAAHALCPVAIVRAPATGPGADTGLVVVGVDGSAASLGAAALAAREAAGRSQTLVVLHARLTAVTPYSPLQDVPPPPTMSTDDPTHRAALEVAEDLRREQPGLEVQVELLDGDPAHALVFATRHADLVVVGSRGMGAFRGMLLGSVSNEVVRDAASTVLVVRDARHVAAG
ncbi:universal stress protein [Puerhibacterium sp. TATVAM-FAB25]|uniref:universal stress protein n=1 Tax=Puerhibacterium sp. TATVAM-FAB25 TaxID=3093699 RepID=UPI00397C34A6